MASVAHRVTPNRARELRERAWALAEERLRGRIICSLCKSTVDNYAERCPADDATQCPGDRAWSEAFAQAQRELDPQ